MFLASEHYCATSCGLGSRKTGRNPKFCSLLHQHLHHIDLHATLQRAVNNTIHSNTPTTLRKRHNASPWLHKLMFRTIQNRKSVTSNESCLLLRYGFSYTCLRNWYRKTVSVLPPCYLPVISLLYITQAHRSQ